MTRQQLQQVQNVANVKPSDLKEWAACLSYGVERNTHDSVAYDKGSDIEAPGVNGSVKSSKFTLMSGSLCEGLTDFDSIWNLYANRVHSTSFMYITNDYVMYTMNLNEFKTFVYAFCGLEKESSKNGGAMKIRCRAESKKMIQWLEERVA